MTCHKKKQLKYDFLEILFFPFQLMVKIILVDLLFFYSDNGKFGTWGLRCWHSSPLFHCNLDLNSLWEDGLEKIDRKPNQTKSLVVSDNLM